jgi:hypothetical protein
MCKSPIVYHAYVASAAVYRDMIRGTISCSSDRQIISHRVRSLALYQELLNDLTPTNLDEALLTAALIEVGNLEWMKWNLYTTILVQPHFPSANWINVAGRVIGDPVAIRRSMQMVLSLIDRRGGLDNVAVTGAKQQIALYVYRSSQKWRPLIFH